jgi:hypothetical protein
MLGSGFLEFKLNDSETKNLAIGQRVSSESFSAGGHLWGRLYVRVGKTSTTASLTSRPICMGEGADKKRV